jgi:hypothetical protein
MVCGGSCRDGIVTRAGIDLNLGFSLEALTGLCTRSRAQSELPRQRFTRGGHWHEEGDGQ